ncbi:MAG TPA: hypothetical protein PK239_04050 [Chitinophagales bacterium]|nr:hypothetical protein [Chitinophagales bacterium]HRK26443.1 hypothetical protein [Chitinophagales bacterium]
MESIIVNYILPLGIWLTIIGFIAVIVMALYQVVNGLMSDPTATVKGLAGILLMLVVFFIIWQLSPSEKTGIFMKSKYADITPGTMKFIGAGISATAVLLVSAFVSLIAAEIYNIFK